MDKSDIMPDPLAAFKTWETVTDTPYETTERLKVEGGWLYHRLTWEDQPHGETGTMCFVPDVDLLRYQAHLRDAYNKGFADGLDEGKAHKELLAE